MVWTTQPDVTVFVHGATFVPRRVLAARRERVGFSDHYSFLLENPANAALARAVNQRNLVLHQSRVVQFTSGIAPLWRPDVSATRRPVGMRTQDPRHEWLTHAEASPDLRLAVPV